MTTPTTHQLNVARARGLSNVAALAAASARAKVPFHVACALMEKESHGRNVYGNDPGGVLSGFPHPVTESNFAAFWWEVSQRGQTSNGVGPSQLTSRGLIQDCISAGLDPWDPEDNMTFGLRTLKRYHKEADGSWRVAGERYNGSPVYGQDLVERIRQWQVWLA